MLNIIRSLNLPLLEVKNNMDPFIYEIQHNMILVSPLFRLQFFKSVVLLSWFNRNTSVCSLVWILNHSRGLILILPLGCMRKGHDNSLILSFSSSRHHMCLHYMLFTTCLSSWANLLSLLYVTIEIINDAQIWTETIKTFIFMPVLR